MISVFPVLNQKLFKVIDYSYTDVFATKINTSLIPLELRDSDDENNVKILQESDDEPWSLKDSNLLIKRTVCIKNPKLLFGEQGIACKKSKIGIGLRWSSQNSRQRNICEIAEIDNKTQGIKKSVSLSFEKSSLINNLVLETILYLKESGIPEENEKFLGNKQGIVLGVLDGINIRLDGNGSEFPIFEDETSLSSDPLWSLKVDCNEPASSSFYDCFQLYLNIHNPNYKYVDKTKDTFDPYLLIEIVSTALTILVLKLKEDPDDWNEMDNNIGLEDDSISKAVYYFKHDLNMDFDNPASIHESFRRYYEQKFKRVK